MPPARYDKSYHCAGQEYARQNANDNSWRQEAARHVAEDYARTPPRDGAKMPSESKRTGSELNATEQLGQIGATAERKEDVTLADNGVPEPENEAQASGDEVERLHRRHGATGLTNQGNRRPAARAKRRQWGVRVDREVRHHLLPWDWMEG